MSPKTLLVILVLIAILAGVAIWRGQRDEGEVNSKENREDPPGQDFFLFKRLGGGGDTLVIARLVGCNRNGRRLTFNGTCDARIMPGGSRQSRFVLKPVVPGSVKACYGFNKDQIDSCHNEGRGTVDSTKWFVVTKDEALLRLYCQLNTGCTVTVE